MRYYLDTNILIFVLFDKYRDELSSDVLQIVEDYSNRLYVSSIVVRELVQLYKDGSFIRDVEHKSAADLFRSIEKLGIDIVPMDRRHLMQYAELETVSGHKDPNDHIIIAQAIADKIPVISSDQKFKKYIAQGLDFVFNRR
jgi:PIN domain nuclease of toxin-antitoxin system